MPQICKAAEKDSALLKGVTLFFQENMIFTRIILLLVGTVFLPISSAFAVDIKLAGRAAVLMEARSGKIIWGRNQDVSLAPASTTKILTALVVLERSKAGNTVTVPAEATKATGGSARLYAGERLSIEQLLYGMMLGSANDAAVALAYHAGGSLTAFVRLMNDKARNLGAQRSHFHNPTGLPQRGHVTTARDLALITRAALNSPEFRKIVATQKYPWRSAQWQGEMSNSNLLLENYPGAIGVKTGQTREAGFCLVTAATRGEESFIAVILKSNAKSGWQDAQALLDYGFASLRSER